MAELTALESKIGEVLGLAMAAQDATKKVTKLVEQEGDHGDLAQALQQMAQEATEMMSTYLGDDADALDGFEFLTMAEAGEVGHWQVVGTMNQRAQLPGLQELVEWVTPIQQRHFQQTLNGSIELAEDEDPNEPEG